MRRQGWVAGAWGEVTEEACGSAQIARASSPPEERQSATHMLMVVGRALITSMPSRKGGASHPAAARALHEKSVTSGMSRRLNDWMSACRRNETAARDSSLVGRLSPESRKMPQVAPQATVSSGRNGPPRRPTDGKTAASATAPTTPTRK